MISHLEESHPGVAALQHDVPDAHAGQPGDGRVGAALGDEARHLRPHTQMASGYINMCKPIFIIIINSGISDVKTLGLRTRSRSPPKLR